MPTATDWSSRPVPTAMSPERLASLVDASLARTEGMLFTATPTEELDAIGRWQRLKDLAFAGLMRDIVAAYNRAGGAEREFAADEVGLAVGATSTTGGNLVGQALSLAALPGLLEAVDAGQLTERHVLAVLRELDRVELTLEQRQAVVLVMLARYRSQAPGELGRLVARLIVQVDRAAAASRDRKAAAARRVWFSRDVDGQAVVVGRGPAEQIAAVRAALEAGLADDDVADDDDDRNRQAREFDLFVELLTGGTDAASWHAEIVVPVSVTAGGEMELAEIPGLGPILPSTARNLLEQCTTLAPTAVDETGVVIAVGDPTRPATDAYLLRALNRAPAPAELAGTGYRFPPRLRRFLEARDRTCVFPGCHRPASRTDKDHRIPWPAGATSAVNGQCLCRHHHRAKHTVFTVTRQPDGTHTWTSRGSWQFDRQPKGC